MTPEEYMNLSEEYAALQLSTARGEDTPESDTRMAEIEKSLRYSGLYFDPDSGEVREPITIGELIKAHLHRE